MQQVVAQLFLSAIDYHLKQRGGERIGRQSYHDTFCAGEQKLHRLHTEAASEQAVKDRWCPPPLIVPQYGNTGLKADGVFDAVGNLLRMSGTFCHDDQAVSYTHLTLPTILRV